MRRLIRPFLACATAVLLSLLLSGSWAGEPDGGEGGSSENAADFLASLGAASADALLPDGNRPLHVAAERASGPALVNWLIKNGASLSAEGLEGLTPLMLAAAYNPDPSVAEALLQGGASLEARDASGRTPLHLAAAMNDSPRVTALLLRHGASAASVDNAGRTPLWLAAARSDAQCVELLLDAGAPVDTPNREGVTPLQAACERPHAGTIRPLVEAGADVNRRDTHRYTPVMRAVAAGADEEALRALLRGRADVLAEDDQNRSALFLAAANPQVPAGVVAMLLGDGAADTRDSGLMTPLMEACRARNLPAARVLLEHGANPALRDKSEWTPLTFAVMSSPAEGPVQEAVPALIHLLTSFDASLDLGTRDGITPLMLTAHGPAQVGSLRALAAAGASVNRQSRQGMTALMVAAASGNEAGVSALIALSADVSLKDEDGLTALAHAVQAQADGTAVVERLVRAGAEVDARAERQTTPLMDAALRDSGWAVRALLRAGAD
ncbi:MAG: ankyrin repeat domain-containing protein, partial [Fretibacterium sp.]|nr:ankyrin repeat domain-containing protein [Fretibacterium sp.]